MIPWNDSLVWHLCREKDRLRFMTEGHRPHSSMRGQQQGHLTIDRDPKSRLNGVGPVAIPTTHHGFTPASVHGTDQCNPGLVEAANYRYRKAAVNITRPGDMPLVAGRITIKVGKRYRQSRQRDDCRLSDRTLKPMKRFDAPQIEPESQVPQGPCNPDRHSPGCKRSTDNVIHAAIKIL